VDTLGFPFWGEHKSGKENKICFLILEIDHFVEKNCSTIAIRKKWITLKIFLDSKSYTQKR